MAVISASILVKSQLLVFLIIPALVLAGVPSRPLRAGLKPIKIVMYDFDGAIVRNSLGEEVLTACKKKFSNECDGKGQMVKTYEEMVQNGGNFYFNHGTAENVNYTSKGPYEGTTRLKRLQDHIVFVMEAGVDIYMVTTSWEKVNASEWAGFIMGVYKDADLFGFLYDKVLALNDPGPGIPADKSAVIEKKLNELNVAPDEAIFLDDSYGNIMRADGKVDTVWLEHRDGIDFTEFNYVEGRIVIGQQQTCANGAKEIAAKSFVTAAAMLAAFM